jgi:hypothetical protein
MKCYFYDQTEESMDNAFGRLCIPHLFRKLNRRYLEDQLLLGNIILMCVLNTQEAWVWPVSQFRIWP